MKVLILVEEQFSYDALITKAAGNGIEITLVGSVLELFEALESSENLYSLVVVGLFVPWLPKAEDAEQRAAAIGLGEPYDDEVRYGVSALRALRARERLERVAVITSDMDLERILPSEFLSLPICRLTSSQAAECEFLQDQLGKRMGVPER